MIDRYVRESERREYRFDAQRSTTDSGANFLGHSDSAPKAYAAYVASSRGLGCAPRSEADGENERDKSEDCMKHDTQALRYRKCFSLIVAGTDMGIAATKPQISAVGRA